MTLYNVHIYRQMRLSFGGIEAGSHEEAARIAHDRPSEDADSLADCEGNTFAALVDVAGDESFEQSRTIEFGPRQDIKGAPEVAVATSPVKELLAALDIIASLCKSQHWTLAHRWRIERIASNAIGQARAA